MPKYDTLQQYVDTFNEPASRMYQEFLALFESIDLDVKHRLFAGQVAFYVEATLRKTFHSSPVIVMAFFADHVNVFALANTAYRKRLPQYKFTAKGTMQIRYGQELDHVLLARLFADSLQ